jgi:hypothetical protein
MALVGVITPGVVQKVLDSVAFAGADVLVLFNHEHASGHVLVEQGKVVTARLGELRDEAALAALREWTTGHYTLIKRGHVDQTTRGHVALGIPDSKARRTLARWLKSEDYETSIIANPQQGLETIIFLQPDLVLTVCPKTTLRLSCAQLDQRLRESMRLPPALVVLGSTGVECSESSPPCVRTVATVDGLQGVLAQDWTGTRLGVRAAKQEQTARIVKPSPRPPGQPASEEMLALALGGSLAKPTADGLTAPDLLLALLVLLVGSAAIWLGLLAR